MPATIRTKTKPLGDRHMQITVSPRLVFITKALKTKPENRLVALYAGFDTAEAAERFAAWAQVNWDKTAYNVTVREGERTQSRFEVKVRKPSEAQLQALVAKTAQQSPNALPVGTAPLLPRRKATQVKGYSID